MKRRDKIKPCLDCEVSTASIGEHFYLKNEIWFKVHNNERGFLCISCIEKRLGRKLGPSDFTDASINKPQRGIYMSQRLANRLGYV